MFVGTVTTERKEKKVDIMQLLVESLHFNNDDDKNVNIGTKIVGACFASKT